LGETPAIKIMVQYGLGVMEKWSGGVMHIN
jgi:hypothetical protein